MLSLISLFVSSYFTTTCFVGAGVNVSVSFCTNPSHDLCLTAQTTSGIIGYQCGDSNTVAQYDALIPQRILASVDNCSGAFGPCNTFAGTPTFGSCDFITDQDLCVARPDCYWCGNSIFAVGMCLTSPPIPCSSLPALVVPQLCQSVTCPSYTPYTAEVLTLKYLTDRENYPIGSIGPPLGVIALDIISLRREVRFLNDTRNFCLTDDELYNWCGTNSSRAWAYCIVSEKWPQEDVYGWLENTTFAGFFQMWNNYPVYCACNNPGRAFYIPRNPGPFPKYGPPCYAEHALLAMNVLVLVMLALLFLWVLFDFFVLLHSMWTKEKHAFLGSAKVKIAILLYILIRIADIATRMSFFNEGEPIPQSPYNTRQLLFVWLNIGSSVVLQFAYLLAVFTFVGFIVELFTVIKSKHLFPHAKLIFDILKWGYVFFSTILLIAVIVLVGVITNISLYLFNPDIRQSEVLSNVPRLLACQQAAVFILMFQCGTAIIVSLLFVGYAIFLILHQKKMLQKTTSALDRSIALIFACVFAIPYFAVLLYVFIISLNNVKTNPTTYLSNVAQAWIIWASNFAEVFWMFFTAYSMRSLVSRAWLTGHFSTLRTSSESTGSMTGGATSGSRMDSGTSID